MKVICTLSILLIALTSISCSQSNIITFEEGQFQIEKPESWSVMEQQNEGVDVQVGIPTEELFVTCLINSHQKTGDLDMMPLQGYYNIAIMSLSSDLVTTSYKKEELTVNGYPAIRSVIHADYGQIPCQYWLVCIETPSHFHEIHITTSEELFEFHRENIEKVLNSFKAVE